MASKRTQNIFGAFSKVYVYDSVFKIDLDYLQRYLSYHSVYNFYGSFLFLGIDSYGYLSKSTFTGGNAFKGGAIYLASEASIEITGCYFGDNQAQKRGGAIFSSNSLDVTIYGGSEFYNNYAEDQGDHLYVADASYNWLTINDTTFNSNIARTSAVFAENIYVRMNGVSTSSITQLESSTIRILGGFLRCQNCLHFAVENSNFKGITSATFGGVLHLYHDDQYKESAIPSDPTYEIKTTVFQNNSANVGAGAYLDNIDFLQITNSTFFDNKALYDDSIEDSGTAGGIYFSCNKETELCSVEFTDNSSYFIENFAYR